MASRTSQRWDDNNDNAVLSLEHQCQGAPTFLSYPHFYLAPAQQRQFAGLQPDRLVSLVRGVECHCLCREAHRTFLGVEPNTGLSLQLHSRIQINVPVGSSRPLANLYKLESVLCRFTTTLTCSPTTRSPSWSTSPRYPPSPSSGLMRELISTR